ncbi:MAG: hypothetical protein KKD39_09145 [Candidatus Altiarchaeota archaeon]|nr:hypothetical protein [Candidatus Altiarchaeota archaeon]
MPVDATLIGMFLLPIIFTVPLIASLILIIKDPDPIYTVLYLVVTTVAFMVADVIYGTISTIPLFNPSSLAWVFSSITQGFLAMIGILGSFLIYHLQTLKDISRQVRKEIQKNISDFDYSKMVVDDRSFLDYLRRVFEQKKGQDVKYAIYFLSLILEERKEVNQMIKHQFILLFMSVFMSLLILLVLDGYFILYGIFFKMLVYAVFSISMAALLSTVRGIFKLTKTGALQ